MAVHVEKGLLFYNLDRLDKEEVRSTRAPNPTLTLTLTLTLGEEPQGPR